MSEHQGLWNFLALIAVVAFYLIRERRSNNE